MCTVTSEKWCVYTIHKYIYSRTTPQICCAEYVVLYIGNVSLKL